MRKPRGIKARINHVLLPHLFCQKRLPFLIWLLSLSTVIISNVISYVGTRKPVIVGKNPDSLRYSSRIFQPVTEIGAIAEPFGYAYSIKDNAVRLAIQYAHRLIDVVQWLQSQQAFKGTGITLSLSNRINHKDYREVWTKPAPETDASFCNCLPKTNSNEHS
jgi:light-regulated signal transduction histidine kinase (bacteriophytochrome)